MCFYREIHRLFPRFVVLDHSIHNSVVFVVHQDHRDFFENEVRLAFQSMTYLEKIEVDVEQHDKSMLETHLPTISDENFS